MKKSSATKSTSGNLEALFRQGMATGSARPSDQVWSRISQDLDDRRNARRNKRRAFLYLSLALLTVLVTGAAVLYTLKPAALYTTAVQPTGNTQKATALNHATSRQTTLSDNVQQASQNKQTSANQSAQNTEISTNNKPSSSAATTSIVADNGTNIEKNTSHESAHHKTPTSSQISAVKNQISNFKAKHRQTAKALATGNKGKNNTGFNKENRNAAKQILPVTTPHEIKVNAAAKAQLDKNENLAANLPITQNNQLSAPPISEAKAPAQMPDALPPVLNGLSDSLSSTAAANPTTADSAAAGVTTPEPVKHKFTLSVEMAQYEFEQGIVLSTNAPSPTSANIAYRNAAQQFNEFTLPSNSYRAEIRVGYHLRGRFRLEAGLNVSKNKAIVQSSYRLQGYVLSSDGTYQSSGQTGILEPVLSGSSPDSIAVQQVPDYATTYTYQFVALPVKVVYQSDQKGWHWYASAGASAGRMVGFNTSSTAQPAAPNLRNSTLQRWQLSSTASFGLGYQLGKVSVHAGPDLSYTFTPLLRAAQVGVKQKQPYTVGLSAGCTVRF